MTLTKAEIQQILFDGAQFSSPEEMDKSYMAGRLVQCTLPHSDPGNIPIWRRVNGELQLSIQPLIAPDNKAWYPYGTMPRLLMYWVVTEAVKTKNRKLFLGKNLASAMRRIGVRPNGGGPTSPSTSFKNQCTRLFRSTISFESIGIQDRQKWLDMKIASEGDIWWEPEGKSDTGSWQGYILLGERFYENITRGPIPLSYETIRHLKGSSLALDLYAWLTYTSYRALRKDEPRRITWGSLAEQFGSDYARERKFREKVIESLDRIIHEYPALRVTHDAEALTIYPARPHIAPRNEL